jgi:hypothetical protein
MHAIQRLITCRTLGLAFASLALCVATARAQSVGAAGAAIEGSGFSSGAVQQSGAFGTFFATIGEPLVSDTLNERDEFAWIGIQSVLHPDMTVGVREERMFVSTTGISIGVIAPDPFFDHALIPIQIARPGEIELVAYDMTGRAIETLVSGMRPAGGILVAWKPGDIPAGSYMLRLRFNGMPVSSQVVHFMR